VLTSIEAILYKLKGSRVYAKIDLKSGFWQMMIQEKDRWKTAFRTRKGLFEFNVMPFGLKNAPAHFQRCMDEVLYMLIVKKIYYVELIKYWRNYCIIIYVLSMLT